MEGRSLALNAGPNEIVLPGSEAGCSDGLLWLYLEGVTLARAFALLSDAQNTRAIEFRYGEMKDRFEGYTRLTGLMERDGRVSSLLEKEETAGV